jgi:hypothetical protein
MTVIGSNAVYRTLRADRVSRVPAGVNTGAERLNGTQNN